MDELKRFSTIVDAVTRPDGTVMIDHKYAMAVPTRTAFADLKGLNPLDWITETVAIGTCEGPFPDDAMVIDVRSVKDHCFIPAVTFKLVLDRIDAGLKKKGKVVVHCIGGVSRSPTFVAVWLALNRGISLDLALALIRSHRPKIEPHPEQLRAAREFLASM